MRTMLINIPHVLLELHLMKYQTVWQADSRFGPAK